VHKLNQPLDFILYAGDDVARFQDGGTNYFAELSKLTKQGKVLAVIGNDDIPDVRRVLDAEGVHDLHEDPFSLGDFGFIGLEASTCGPGLTKHSEEEVAEHLEEQYLKLKGKRLIVVSHTPPFGILDRGIRFAREDEYTHHIVSAAIVTHMVDFQLNLEGLQSST